jgi:hypothetical protein
MGMPRHAVSYVRKAEGECRFLSLTEMLHVRSVPVWHAGPMEFYEYKDKYHTTALVLQGHSRNHFSGGL